MPRTDRGSALPGRRLVPGALLASVLLVTACAQGAPPERPTAPPPMRGPQPTAAPVDPRPAATSVRIDAIGVDSPLDPTGIAPDGTAEVPTDFDRVGWFARSPPGVTVLLGHVDSTSGPAVFFRLRDLRPGAEITVGTADGDTTRYRVERTEQVPKDEFPTFAVFGAGSGSGAVLRLVTCAGEFDRGERSYVDNLVVHAVRA